MKKNWEQQAGKEKKDLLDYIKKQIRRKYLKRKIWSKSRNKKRNRDRIRNRGWNSSPSISKSWIRSWKMSRGRNTNRNRSRSDGRRWSTKDTVGRNKVVAMGWMASSKGGKLGNKIKLLGVNIGNTKIELVTWKERKSWHTAPSGYPWCIHSLQFPGGWQSTNGEKWEGNKKIN